MDFNLAMILESKIRLKQGKKSESKRKMLAMREMEGKSGGVLNKQIR